MPGDPVIPPGRLQPRWAKPWSRIFAASLNRWSAEVSASTVPTTVREPRVAANTRQNFASGPEPVFTPNAPRYEPRSLFEFFHGCMACVPPPGR